MKKNIGSVMGLYPTPLAVVGAMVLGRVNWVLVGHLGIMGHDRVMISLAKPHFTNQGILESGLCSVNIVDEAMLPQADEAGRVSGAKTDKSGLFAWHAGEAGAPVADASPLVMECSVADVYETKGFDNFILKIENTYADERVLNDQGKIDYAKLKPVLFEMPTYSYLRAGEVLGRCLSFAREQNSR